MKEEPHPNYYKSTRGRRFCRKCGNRILGRGNNAVECLGCKPKKELPAEATVLVTCEGCPAQIARGRSRFCADCSSARARQSRRRLKLFVLERAQYRCQYCGDPLSLVTVTIDHYIPRILGGTDDKENLRAACITCNCRKGTKHPDTIPEGFFQMGQGPISEL